jgi:hypothetical protein
MRVVKVAGAAACVGLLAGCAPTLNETSFAATREGLIGSPALRQQYVATCEKKIRQDPNKLQESATLVNLSVADAPGVICQRLLKAAIDGRFNYAQYLEAKKGERDS